MTLIIKAKMWDEKLSEHFSLREFRCECNLESCQETKIDSRLIKLLEDIRQVLGRPLKVTSGYRCSEHNAFVGGVPGSQHPQGLAVDILVPDEKHYIIEAMVGDNGFGRYDGRVHIDLRGHKARWDFRTNKKGDKGDGKLS